MNEFIAVSNLPVSTLNLGIPDRFVAQDKPAQMLADCGLNAAGIHTAITARLAALATTESLQALRP